MIYCFEVVMPGKSESETVEITSPSEDMALMLLIAMNPHIHIVQYVGSYVEGAKGVA